MSTTTSVDAWQIVMLAIVAFIVYKIVRCKRENFVPYNAFEAPATSTLDVNTSELAHAKFGTLVQTINGTQFALSFELESLSVAFETALNQVSLGRYKVLSIGQTLPFSFLNVQVLDKELGEVFQFKRVDFIVSSLSPFVIDKIIVSPVDSEGTVKGVDELSEDSTFRIKNPMGLFYPYATSYDETVLSQTAIQSFITPLIPSTPAENDAMVTPSV